jgi:peroxiredoxin family protein
MILKRELAKEKHDEMKYSHFLCTLERANQEKLKMAIVQLKCVPCLNKFTTNFSLTSGGSSSSSSSSLPMSPTSNSSGGGGGGSKANSGSMMSHANMSRLLKQMSLIVSTELQQIAIDLIERMDEDKPVKYIRLKDEFKYTSNSNVLSNNSNNNSSTTCISSSSTSASSLSQQSPMQQHSSSKSNTSTPITNNVVTAASKAHTAASASVAAAGAVAIGTPILSTATISASSLFHKQQQQQQQMNSVQMQLKKLTFDKQLEPLATTSQTITTSNVASSVSTTTQQQQQQQQLRDHSQAAVSSTTRSTPLLQPVSRQHISNPHINLQVLGIDDKQHFDLFATSSIDTRNCNTAWNTRL